MLSRGFIEDFYSNNKVLTCVHNLYAVKMSVACSRLFGYREECNLNVACTCWLKFPSFLQWAIDYVTVYSF